MQLLAFKTRPKIEGHKIFAMGKYTQEENLSQPLQTNREHFKIAVIFLTGFNGIFIVLTQNKKFFFLSAINDDDFNEVHNLEGAQEVENKSE